MMVSLNWGPKHAIPYLKYLTSTNLVMFVSGPQFGISKSSSAFPSNGPLVACHACSSREVRHSRTKAVAHWLPWKVMETATPRPWLEGCRAEGQLSAMIKIVTEVLFNKTLAGKASIESERISYRTEKFEWENHGKPSQKKMLPPRSTMANDWLMAIQQDGQTQWPP